MTPATKQTIFFTILFAGLAVAGYFGYQKLVAKSVTKSDKVVEILSQSGGEGDYNFIMGLADTFVNAWYAAVVAKAPTFVDNGSTFDTTTGKAVPASL